MHIQKDSNIYKRLNEHYLKDYMAKLQAQQDSGHGETGWGGPVGKELW